MVKSQVCPNCDKSFSYDTISTRGPRKYCSDPCSEQYAWKVRKARLREITGDTVTRACLVCGGLFSYTFGRGKGRKRICSPGCEKKRTVQLQEARKRLRPTCNTPGCRKPADRPSFGLCEACYYRLRRTGSVVRKGAQSRFVNGEGYVRLIFPGHPLAQSRTGYVFEHRKVLFDKYGEGQHPCFWCGRPLSWSGIRGDHLNEVKGDNRPDNLVISCNKCNRARGALLPFVRRMRLEALPVFFDCVRDQRLRSIDAQKVGQGQAASFPSEASVPG